MEGVESCWLLRCLDTLTVEQVAQLLYDPTGWSPPDPTHPHYDPTGSSVDLAPSLMTIYDNYVSANGSTTVKEVNHNTLGPPPPLEGPQDALGLPPSGGMPLSAGPGTDKAAVSAALRQTVNHEVRLPYVASMDSVESDGPPAALGPGPVPYDASKKRPLSISSTSSTTSSTSSLPRPQRKKLAGGGGLTVGSSPLVANGHPAGVTGLRTTGSGDYMTGSTHGVTSCSVLQAPGGQTVLDMSGVDVDDDHSARSPSQTPPFRQDSGSGGSVSYIDKVVAEILETERAYVNDLREIIQGYLYELRSDPDSRLDTTDINALFGNIEEIYDFNKVFLGELESCQQDAVRLAQCFVDQNEGFVIYSDYCTNYPGAVEVLTAVMGSPDCGDVFRQQQAQLGHNLPLGAYLLKPVQRILKYHLLLQNMLSHMEEGGEGASVVSAALASMTNMAQHINEMKRKHEHAVRITEMQGLLYDWDGADLTTFGELVLEETFRMHGAKGDRHLLLFEKGLLIAKHKDDAGLMLKDCIKCSNLMLVESIPREPLSFHVIPFDNPRGQYTFQARSLDQKRQWCLELKRLILESYTADKAIPANVKDLVLTLTSRHDRTGGALPPLSTPKSCPAPDYLDRKRRPRRRSVTSVLPDFSHLKSQVTKKVMPKKGEGVSPKVSPRVRRRRSDSAVPRDTVTQLINRQKTHELCEVEDLSDTDSTEQGLYRSMENLPPGQLDTLDSPAFRCGEWGPDDECGSVDSTPTKSPARLSWPDDPDYSRSPSPLKRRESFRIATMLHRVDSRKPPGGRRPAHRPPASAGPKPVKESKVRSFLQSRRRVSEGDLHSMTRRLEVGGGDYRKVGPCPLATEEDGDDEAEDEPLYSTVGDHLGVQLVQDQEGDYTELALHARPLQEGGDSNNNPSDGQLRGDRPRSRADSHPRPVAQQAHLVSKGLRASEGGAPRPNLNKQGLQVRIPRLDRSVSPCGRPAGGQRQTPTPQTASPCVKSHPLSADQTGLYDNLRSQWASGDGLGQDNQQQNNLSLSPQPSECNTALLQSYLNSNLRPKDLGLADNQSDQKSTGRSSKANPWVPRAGSPTSDIGPRPRLRSNSLTLLTESSDLMDNRRKSHHRRLPSDTLVFVNRSAFVCSGSAGTVHKDVDTERAIARLATPPRDLGPMEAIQQVRDCQQRGRVLSRYATPPRSLTSSGSLGSDSTIVTHSHSEPTEGSLGGQSRISTTMPADMKYTGPTFWTDLEEFMAQSPSSNHSPPLPRFPPADSGYYRQSSLNETSSTYLASPSRPDSLQSPTSPSSVTSSDSIVESLKQAVFSFTSRIASHLPPRSTESSPRRAPRCRSISALEELRVENLQDLQKPCARKKDRRGKFVAQLAKVYSEHVRKRGRSASIDRKSPFKEKDPTKLTKQLTNLLKEGKPGSSIIGERMAACKPVVLGTYTLPRHRPPRPKKGATGGAAPQEETDGGGDGGEESPDTVVRRRGQKEEGDSGHSSAYDSGCLDVGVKDLSLDGGGEQRGAEGPASPSLQATLQAFNAVYASGMDTSDDDSSIYYYERKFVEDLESNFGDDVFRDSAVYSDEGCGPSVDPEAASRNISIRETMKLIEQRSRTRSVPRTTEVRQEEKAKGIKDILRTLEQAGRLEPLLDPRASTTDSETADKAMLKSIRDRTRELVECATLTRIRQTALQVGEDSGDEAPPEAAGGEASPPLRRGRSRSRRW